MQESQKHDKEKKRKEKAQCSLQRIAHPWVDQEIDTIMVAVAKPPPICSLRPDSLNVKSAMKDSKLKCERI
jgi:hypothetical protein